MFGIRKMRIFAEGEGGEGEAKRKGMGGDGC